MNSRGLASGWPPAPWPVPGANFHAMAGGGCVTQNVAAAYQCAPVPTFCLDSSNSRRKLRAASDATSGKESSSFADSPSIRMVRPLRPNWVAWPPYRTKLALAFSRTLAIRHLRRLTRLKKHLDSVQTVLCLMASEIVHAMWRRHFADPGSIE